MKPIVGHKYKINYDGIEPCTKPYIGNAVCRGIAPEEYRGGYRFDLLDDNDEIIETGCVFEDEDIVQDLGFYYPPAILEAAEEIRKIKHNKFGSDWDRALKYARTCWEIFG